VAFKIPKINGIHLTLCTIIVFWVFVNFVTGGNTPAQNNQQPAQEGSSASANSSHNEAPAEDTDYAAAIQRLTPLAEQGDADAQDDLGGAYINLAIDGKFASQEEVDDTYRKGIEWKTAAAKSGKVDAQITVGTEYASGDHIRRNFKAAIEWYRLAIKKQKSPIEAYRSFSILEEIWQHNGAVPQDIIKDIEIKAEQGDPGAQNNLSTMYMSGKGVAHNLQTGMLWLRKAAYGGFNFSQGKLGFMFSLFPLEDDAETYFWYSIANTTSDHSNNYPDYKDSLDRIGPKLSPTTLLKLQQRIAAWGHYSPEEADEELKDFKAAIEPHPLAALVAARKNGTLVKIKLLPGRHIIQGVIGTQGAGARIQDLEEREKQIFSEDDKLQKTSKRSHAYLDQRYFVESSLDIYNSIVRSDKDMYMLVVFNDGDPVYISPDNDFFTPPYYIKVRPANPDTQLQPGQPMSDYWVPEFNIETQP